MYLSRKVDTKNVFSTKFFSAVDTGMDGKSMSKDKSTCIFHGPAPMIRKFDSQEEEVREMIRDIRNVIAASVPASDICVMVRSNSLLYNIRDRLEMNGLQALTVTNKQPDDKSIPGVRIMTMCLSSLPP